MKFTSLIKVVLLVVICYNISSAQNAKIDSLKLLLPSRTGVDQVEVLFELGRAYDAIDNDLLFKFSAQAFDLATMIGDTARIVKCGRLMAQAFRQLGVMDSAEFLFKKVLPIAQRHNYLSEKKTILNSLGTVYLQTAQYDKALTLYFQALVLAKDDSDKFRETAILNNIGLVYQNLRDYQNALVYFKKSLFLSERPEVGHRPTSTWINVSLCLTAQGNNVEAQTYIDRVLIFCGGKCSLEIIAYTHNAQGRIWNQTLDLDKAEQEFNKSNTLAEDLGNNKLVLENLGYLLSISIKKRHQSSTEKYLKQIENLVAAGTPYNFELIQVYPKLFDFYLETGNFEKAALCQNKYITLKDSIYNKELTVNLMRIQTQHLEKENVAKIETQNKILSLNEQVITRQFYLNIFVVIVSVLLLSVIILLIKINKRKQTINLLLDKKVQQRTRELEINRDALQRACDERDIIIEKTARDIKTSLATIKGLCSVGLKDVNDPNGQEYLTRVDITSDGLSTILRNLFYLNKTRVGS